jgi:hypothetical protein
MREIFLRNIKKRKQEEKNGLTNSIRSLRFHWYSHVMLCRSIESRTPVDFPPHPFFSSTPRLISFSTIPTRCLHSLHARPLVLFIPRSLNHPFTSSSQVLALKFKLSVMAFELTTSILSSAVSICSTMAPGK